MCIKIKIFIKKIFVIKAFYIILFLKWNLIQIITRMIRFLTKYTAEIQNNNLIDFDFLAEHIVEAVSPALITD